MVKFPADAPKARAIDLRWTQSRDSTTCHDTPCLSFSQPIIPCEPPPEDSLSRSVPTSAGSVQFTISDMASVKVKGCAKPLSMAANSCPVNVFGEALP